MAGMNELFREVRRGEPILARDWNTHVAALRRLAKGDMQGGYIINGAGIFRKRSVVGAGGQGCDPRNEIWVFYISGTPTGGSFDVDLTINSVTETLTFNYNWTSAQFLTELLTHSELVSGDVAVAGGPLPDANIIVEFMGDQASREIAIPTINWSSLTGGSGVMVMLGFRSGVP